MFISLCYDGLRVIFLTLASVNKSINLLYFILFLHAYFLFLCNLNKIQWNKFESIFLFWLLRQWIKIINSYLFFYLYIHTSLFFLFFIFLGVGPSSAHVDWAGPSQPSPVTGPSQWPGWAKIKESTREVISRVHEQNRGINLECVNWNSK